MKGELLARCGYLGKMWLPLGISKPWEGQFLPRSIRPPNARPSRIQKRRNTVNRTGPVMNGCQTDQESKKAEQIHTIEIHRLILKLIWKYKGPRRVKTILEIKRRQRTYTEWFQTYYKASVTKTTQWYCPKDRQTQQQTKNRSPDISLPINSWPIFYKGLKVIHWWKDSLLQQLVLKLLYIHMWGQRERRNKSLPPSTHKY